MNKEELYNKYKFLILKVIKDLNCQYRNSEEYEEYIFSAKVGLLNAINNYNPEKISSSSYFYTSIKNSILLSFITKSYNKNKINYLKMASLDSPISEKSELKEIIPDTSINIEQDYLKKEECEFLYRCINKLKPIYKEIICDSFGIYRKPKSVEEISKKYGVSKQTIYVKQRNAISKLKNMYKKEGKI